MRNSYTAFLKTLTQSVCCSLLRHHCGPRSTCLEPQGSQGPKWEHFEAGSSQWKHLETTPRWATGDLFLKSLIKSPSIRLLVRTTCFHLVVIRLCSYSSRIRWLCPRPLCREQTWWLCLTSCVETTELKSNPNDLTKFSRPYYTWLAGIAICIRLQAHGDVFGGGFVHHIHYFTGAPLGDRVCIFIKCVYVFVFIHMNMAHQQSSCIYPSSSSSENIKQPFLVNVQPHDINRRSLEAKISDSFSGLIISTNQFKWTPDDCTN